MTAEERFWEKVNTSGPNGCWVWTASTFRHGYGKFWLDGKLRYAHRVSWKWTNGPIPEGLWVLHKCDNPPCVRPDHLFLGTDLDNKKDKVKKGRQARGSTHGCSRLTEQDVRRIRALVGLGFLQREIAEMFEVSRSHVSSVVNRKFWKHVS